MEKEYFSGKSVEITEIAPPGVRAKLRELVDVVLCVLAVLAVIGFYSYSLPAKAEPAKPSIVEVVELSGEIGDGTAASITKMVETVNDNPRVRAIVLIVNSPGGGAVASSAMYEELSKLKVPVVGWCDHVCASGGMYVLMAPSVKYVGVRNETIAGSIGVIATVTRFNRLLDWAKIDNETYTSGRHKDAFNPTRAAHDEERKYIQGIITELADRFYDVVGKSRQIKDWSAVKTGRIFIGVEAVRVGLADSVMSREEAIKKAKEISGAKIIFTREEMKKMSAAAHENVVYSAPPVQPMTQYGDVASLIEMLKEIREGESVTFAYKMKYRF